MFGGIKVLQNNKRFIAFIISLYLLGFTGSVLAQQNALGKLHQLSIAGNQQITKESLVRMSSGLREGEEISYEDIKKAVKNLWSLGLFSDIQIIQTGTSYEGVDLTIQVEEFPRLGAIKIQGNKKLKQDDIEKELGFFKGQIISSNHISKARKKLLKVYAEKGYTLAKISAESVPSTREGYEDLEITIDEGKKVQVKQIRFFGNTQFEGNKLRKQMKETKEDRWWRGADFKKDKYPEDLEKVLAFYRNNGFRDAEIVKDSLYYSQDGQDMFVDIWVREGLCYYIGKISWEGSTLFPEEYLSSLMELKEGDPFSQEKFQKSIQENIGGAYYDLGYIYAQPVPKETLRGGDTLDIHFTINEGEPVRIRKIIITGNTRTKERVIRREIRIRPGEVFSKELLMRSARDLMMLNYFANVVPNVLPVQSESMDQMDLTFEVEEKSTDTANLSAGYSELDKFIGSVGLGMNNLFGNGQVLSLDWNFGRYYRSFNLGFTEPWFRNTPTLIGASVYDIKRDAYWIGYSQRSRGLKLRFGRRFRWPDNYFRGQWSYRIDRLELGDFDDAIVSANPNNILNQQYPLITSSVSQEISRNSLDNPEFPTRGGLVSLFTEIAGGPFQGNVSYHKHIFSAEYFYPAISNKLIFLARAQVGFLERLAKNGRIPYLDYFFMGGSGLSQSMPLRGYEDPLSGGYIYNEGGKTMMKSTAEIRFPIIPNPTMYGLLFAEAGNTWYDLKSTDPFDLRRSVGIGARLFMPMIGMIGFDYAYGYDNIDSNGNHYGDWKPHFVFGKSF